MAKMKKGQKLPDFEVTTLQRGRTHLSQLVSKTGKTAVVFLRYYGCPVCQYDMMLYKDAYASITAGGNELIVALQSTGRSIADQTEVTFPFDVILDPEMLLYRQLEIPVLEKAPEGQPPFPLTEEILAMIKKIDEMGIKHGPNEGIEEQLPAYFVVDRDLNVLSATYTETPFDAPAPGDFARLFA